MLPWNLNRSAAPRLYFTFRVLCRYCCLCCEKITLCFSSSILLISNVTPNGKLYIHFTAFWSMIIYFILVRKQQLLKQRNFTECLEVTSH